MQPHSQEDAKIPWRWVDDYKCWVTNVLRGFSLASLLLAIVACGSVAAKNGKGDLMEKFDAGRQTFFGLICLFLLISEIEIPVKWIDKCVNQNWPVFAPQAGLVGIGVAQVFVGAHLLASADEEWAKEHDGAVFKKLVIGAGSIVVFIGILNIIASWPCRRRISGNIHFSARQVRSRKYHSQHTLPKTNSDNDFPLPRTNFDAAAIPLPPAAASIHSSVGSTYTGTSKASSVFGYSFEDRTVSRNASTRSNHHHEHQQQQQGQEQYITVPLHYIHPQYRQHHNSPPSPSRVGTSPYQQEDDPADTNASNNSGYTLHSEYLFSPGHINEYVSRSPSTSVSVSNERRVPMGAGEHEEKVVRLSDVRRYRRGPMKEIDVKLAVPQRAYTVSVAAPSSVYSRSVSGTTRIMGQGSI